MRIRYFIPDWDDRVDPNFNFLTDEHEAGRTPYTHDVYAHELFATAPYDGILLSLAALSENKRKRQAILTAGSVHQYLRLPADGKHQVLGDCGAFTYWREAEPPYQTEDVLEAYQELGFDYGVSIDHLIFAEVEAEKQRRWEITIQNARDFLAQHQRGGYSFVPVGVAQGWDPCSYRRAVQELTKMGYQHIAIGGLVRSPTSAILRTLETVKEVLPQGMLVHLFGVNRPESANEFARLGVTSFDSASRLRRAWMDGRRNYFLRDDSYTAIRVPEARQRARKLGLAVNELQYLEKDALEHLRAYDHDQAGLSQTYAASAAYARAVGDPESRIEKGYWRTLAERPWKRCSCSICREIGIEVVIFRGNNRNRRRGFHNTWQLYQQLQALDDEAAPEQPRARQLALSFEA